MKKYILLLLIISSSSILFSQNTNSQNKSQVDSTLFWLNLGIGPSTNGFASMVGFTLVTNKRQVFELLFTQNKQIGLFTSNPEYFRSIDFLYGHSYRIAKKGLFSMSTGLSWFGNMSHGEVIGSSGGILGTSTYKEITENGIGVPIHLHLFRTGFKFIAIGIDAASNINLIKTNFSLTVVLKLGDFDLQKK